MKKTLTIGLGGCGSRLAYQFHTMYSTQNICFNTCQGDVENKNVILLEDVNGKVDGSSRNPEFTLNSVCPHNTDYIQRNIEKYYKDVEKIIVFSSLGGGSGSALHNYIVGDIIKGAKKTFSVMVAPFKAEGNPCNSNFIVMLKMYMERCSKYATPILFSNDDIFIQGGKSTYDITNKSVAEYVYNILDFETFSGKIKKNGLSTLDENEFNRMLEPCQGFVSFNSIKYNDLKEDIVLEDLYDLNTAKKMIILFQGEQQFPMEKLSILHKIFPDPVKIISESLGNGVIKILSNGLDYPSTFKDSIFSTIKNVESHNKKIEKSKVKNKKITENISSKLLRI